MLTVYEKPTCTTCRKLHALLSERGIDFQSVEYHVTGLTEPVAAPTCQHAVQSARGSAHARAARQGARPRRS